MKENANCDAAKLRRLMREEIASAVSLAKDLGIDRAALTEYGAAPILCTVFETARLHSNPSVANVYNADVAASVQAQRMALRSVVPANVPDNALLGLSLCAFADNNREGEWNNLESRSINAAFGHGLFEGVMLATGDPAVAKLVRGRLAALGAVARLANDPKQAAMSEAKKLWRDWQTGKTTHKSGAAFARAVCNAFPIIENPKTVERWVTQWRKEAVTKREKQALS
jgi:hypothetical protein